MDVRALVRRHVPYEAVELARRSLWYGWGWRCPVCASDVRRLLPQGYGFPLLERLQVVGGMYKPADRCPVCHSGDRERHVLHLLRTRLLPALADGARVVHLAPEKGLSALLAARDDIDYVPGDLEPHRYWHLDGVRQLDMLDLPFEDGSVDLLLANHVMEHVPDDAPAMREVRRVLAPGGHAILQVPISLRLDTTLEDPTATTEQARIERFGQSDHVRLYTEDDYVARLRAAGLDVELVRAWDTDEERAHALRIDPLEHLYLCSPSA